ncbi:MAG TPA: UbiA family prenyltransferase [Ohtaekwangia sp.]|nr:UbiA family prenyltransferase [Ohtaekwangia sp.]
MLSRSSWLHLRIPFSYFLLPVFLFATAVSPNITGSNLLWSFLIIHLLLYPASNGYNSYFDKDEKSIGGLKNPPPVKKGLYHLALLFDVVAVLLGALKINLTFAVMLVIYGLVSKAYSHPAVRLKKYAITGWFAAGVFQGIFTFVMCYVGINGYGLENVTKVDVLIPGLLTTIMLWANYPMTQVYQHEEDGKRGDRTLSILLGIRGTFIFAGLVFAVAGAGFVMYFNAFTSPKYASAFVIAIVPVVIYFLIWFFKTYRNLDNASFGYTMWLNFISATCLNIFFIYLFLDATHILQLYR